MDFDRCSSLTKFPMISWNLRTLNLCKTAIEEVPDSTIESLNKLVSLNISNNRKLKNLPTSMRHFMTSLRSLSLNGCSNITEFPHISGKITKLFLCETAIEEVPSFVERLTNLKNLRLDYYKRLNRVSSGVFQLEYLETLSLSLSSWMPKS
ncbi:hypothetical protein Dsin_015252 [Dipteronia sinensis]|uniref:Uncharacterized protein n=1 Tax=Dipteronia sinensis TaxID=43782 RepID=A0AAE0E4D8_9ROSI|nr:hypothetical protein Dsin_015252 [Dipteronia sinensis]